LPGTFLEPQKKGDVNGKGCQATFGRIKPESIRRDEKIFFRSGLRLSLAAMREEKRCLEL
jgi:hypothetical protein